METMAACASCGGEAPASAMDMTGHGLRCHTCAARAELAIFHGGHGANGMAEHLTRAELDVIVVDSRRDIGRGVLAITGGAAAFGVGWLLHAHSFVPLYIAFAGVFGGLGLIGYALYRGGMAKAAIRQSPDARVIQRR
jgi:hypothetical protein